MDPKKYNCAPPKGPSAPITPAEARMMPGGKVFADWAPNLGQTLLSEATMPPPESTSLYPMLMLFPNLTTEDIHSETYSQLLNSFFDPPGSSSHQSTHGSSHEQATVETVKAVKEQFFKSVSDKIFKPIVEKPADEPYQGAIVAPRSETVSYFKYSYTYPEYTYFSVESLPHKISGPPPPIIKKSVRKLKRPSYLSTRRKSTKREKRYARPLRHRVARLR